MSKPIKQLFGLLDHPMQLLRQWKCSHYVYISSTETLIVQSEDQPRRANLSNQTAGIKQAELLLDRILVQPGLSLPFGQLVIPMTIQWYVSWHHGLALG